MEEEKNSFVEVLKIKIIHKRNNGFIHLYKYQKYFRVTFDVRL